MSNFMRQVISRARSGGPWFLAAASYVAVLVQDPGLFGPAVPGDDAARDFSFVYQMLQTRTPVLHGGDVAWGPGQPSPLHLWLLAIGSILAGYLGAYLLYLAAYIVLATIAARILVRTTGSSFAGYGLLLALAVQDRVNMTGPLEKGSTPTWFTSTALANALVLVAIASAVCTHHRWKWSAPVTMAASFTAMSIWSGSGTIGSFLLISGFVSYLRHWKQLSYRHHLVALGIPGFISSLILVRFVGAHAELIEGTRAGLRYMSSRQLSASFAQTWTHGLGNITFGTSHTVALAIWAAAFLLAVVASFRKVRGAFVYLQLLLWGSAVGVFVLPGVEQHILSAIGLIPLVGFSLLTGVIGAKLNGRSPTGVHVSTVRFHQFRKAAATLLSASMVIGALFILVNSSYGDPTEQRRKSRYETTLSYRPEVTKLINAMQSNPLIRQAYENDDLFAYVDNESEMGRITFLAPVVDQFLISGYRICYVREGIPPSKLYGKSPATSLRCKPSEHRHYALMFAMTAQSRGFTPLTSIKISLREGGLDQFAEIVLVKASTVVTSPGGSMSAGREGNISTSS